MITIQGAAGLRALAGQDIGATEWQPLEFSRIQGFADASGDHQWIHVDRERIAKESPYGRPLAHGYLTLALVGGLFFELLSLDGFKMAVNYGANKVRFPAPLREGDRYRLTVKLAEVKDAGEWLEGIFENRIEIEGSAKPACVAECVYRLLPA